MVKILTLAVILSIAGCAKKDKETSNTAPMPTALEKTYNDSTYCDADGCKVYIQHISYNSQDYFAVGYDIGPLCDLAPVPPPIYDENGIEIDQSSDLYSNVSKKGHRGERVWQCKVH